MGYGTNIGMSWMWLFGLLMMAGVLLLVVVVIRAAGDGVTRRDQASGASLQAQSRPRQLLDERYARGEIATEEYRERLQALGEDT